MSEPITNPVNPPAADPTPAPAPAADPAPQLDPTTGLPAQTQKPDPLSDPVVVAELQKLRGQISTLSATAGTAKNLEKQLKDAQAKITEFENAQLSEAEKKEKEYQDALAAAEAANNAKTQAELENIKLRAFIGSGLKPEFLRFVQGSTEDEIKESITELQALIAQSVPAPAPAAPVAAPAVPPVQPQPTAPVTQPQAAPKRTFTHAEIAAMSPAEYAKNRDAILQAAARNEIK